jgi:hypothetical protein
MASVTKSSNTYAAPSPGAVLGRLLLMAALVVVFVLVSTPLRTINPLQLRIATNILFFVALGAADQWFVAPVLNRWPLARAAVLIAETLALGWFFSPGRVNPTYRFLFYTHILPFFAAVFAGALLVMVVQHQRRT